MATSYVPPEIVRRILNELTPPPRGARNERKLPSSLPVQDMAAYCHCALVSRAFLILSREIMLSTFRIVLMWKSGELYKRFCDRADGFLQLLSTTTSSLRYPSHGLNLDIRFTDSVNRKRIFDIFGQALPRINSLACSFTEPGLSEDEQHYCIQQLGFLLGQTRNLSVSGARTHAEVYQWIRTISVHCKDLQELDLATHYAPLLREGQSQDAAALTNCHPPSSLRKMTFFPNQNFVAQVTMQWLSSSQVFLEEAYFPVHLNNPYDRIQDVLNSPACQKLLVLDLSGEERGDVSHLTHLRELHQVIKIPFHVGSSALHSLMRQPQRRNSLHLHLRLRGTSDTDVTIGRDLEALDQCLATLLTTITPSITIRLEAHVKRDIAESPKGIMVWFPKLAAEMHTVYSEADMFDLSIEPVPYIVTII